MFNFGATELLIILAILLVLFGGRKLPQLARSVRDGLRAFQGADEPKPKKLEHK